MIAPRVRFAPSPTGYFHVGSARTALFNWLFARQQGGVFVLRIEDTDAERNREEWVTGITDALDWLGMVPDEGPFRQSERAGRHAAAIDALWEAGALYACDCRREDIDARPRPSATPGYDGFCRDRGLERPGRALRFRMPTIGATVVHDLIRGDVSFPHEAMDDFVAVKSSGQPLFVLANVIDDRDMAITHVIRGEDLLPTTPKGLLLWQALDAAEGTPVPLPAFAHLPMLVDANRKKLSKRKDPVAVESYRDQGFLAEAFRNYLALLGWSPKGDAEKVGVDDLVRRVPPGGRAPRAGLLRRGQAHPHERRVRAGSLAGGVHRRRRPLGGAGARALGAGRGPATLAARHGSTRRCSPDGPPRPRARRHLGRGAGDGRLPLPGRPAAGRGQLGEGRGARRGCAGILAARPGRLRRLRVDARGDPGGHGGGGRGRRPQAGQGPGPDPGGGDRPHGRPAALRVT